MEKSNFVYMHVLEIEIVLCSPWAFSEMSWFLACTYMIKSVSQTAWHLNFL